MLFYTQHVSVQTSHNSKAQYRNVASGYHSNEAGEAALIHLIKKQPIQAFGANAFTNKRRWYVTQSLQLGAGITNYHWL